MEGLIIVGIFMVLVIVTIAMGVRIVPQGSKHVVQRLGKYRITLNPGLNIIIPYVDSVAYKVTTKDIVWYPKPSPNSSSFRFDKTMHFQYWGDWGNRQKGDLAGGSISG